MDCIKTGELISKLRKEKEMTQKQLADRLNISNKTVSKWETGKGAPDVDLIGDLATLLGVDAVKLLEGDIAAGEKNAFKTQNIGFYVCKSCGNFVLNQGTADIYCCGRQLLRQKPKAAMGEHEIKITELGDEWYVCLNHEMKKDHYILFAAYVSWNKLLVVPLYPEQEPSFYMPAFPKGGNIYLYCTKHGLFKIKI